MDTESVIYNAKLGLALRVGRPERSGLADEDCRGKRILDNLSILLFKSADGIDLMHDFPSLLGVLDQVGKD